MYIYIAINTHTHKKKYYLEISNGISKRYLITCRGNTNKLSLMAITVLIFFSKRRKIIFFMLHLNCIKISIFREIDQRNFIQY